MGLVSRFLLRLLGLGLKLLWLGLGDRVRVGVSAKYGRQLCATVILGAGVRGGAAIVLRSTSARLSRQHVKLVATLKPRP